MLRKDPGPSNRSSPPVSRAKINPRTENQQNESSTASAFLGKPILRTTIAIANKKNGAEAGSQSIRRRPGTLSLLHDVTLSEVGRRVAATLPPGPDPIG